MKKLRNLNISVCVIFSVTFFSNQVYDNPLFMLLIPFLFLIYLVLLLISFITGFIKLRDYKLHSFLPFIVLLLFLPLFFIVGFIGDRIGNHGKPTDPKSYFKEDRKEIMTGITQELLQAHNESSEALIKGKLIQHNLQVLDVDIDMDIVKYGFYRKRTWHCYIYAENELPESYSTKPIITENNILQWGELVNIIKTENDLSKYSQRPFFSTEIVYPFLIENLSKELIDKLTSLPPTDNSNFFLSKDERLAVIEVLNRHCRITSRLVESEHITWQHTDRYPDKKTLVFCGHSKLSRSFQVTKHLQRLISEGVVSVQDRAGHLKIKPELNDKEKLEIEWLQIEIMNFIYGNLLQKNSYWSNGKTKLADHWYYYKD